MKLFLPKAFMIVVLCSFIGQGLISIPHTGKPYNTSKSNQEKIVQSDIDGTAKYGKIFTESDFEDDNDYLSTASFFNYEIDFSTGYIKPFEFTQIRFFSISKLYILFHSWKSYLIK